MRPLLLILLLTACDPGAPCVLAEGELTIDQLHLPGPAIGESTLVTAPDGTTLLIDVGNDSHDELVREALGGDAADFVLVTHDHEDHTGGLDDLADVLADAVPIGTTGTYELGGAELVVFLADGLLDLPGGAVDLRAEVDGIDEEENPRSLGGFVRYGDFVYVFAGDLTGGGKGTADVESAVAARGDQLLGAGQADVIHLSHHGISSSTNQAWVDWLLPDDGEDRNAVVGANRGYLAAPHEDVVARVAPRLGTGRIHASATGSLAEDDPALVDHESTVRIAVSDGGSAYSICGETFE